MTFETTKRLLKGGRVIGSSDKIGAVPHDYPIDPPRVLASLYHGMGSDLETVMMPGPGGRPIRLIEAEPTEVEGYRGRAEAELLIGRYADAMADYGGVTAVARARAEGKDLIIIHGVVAPVNVVIVKKDSPIQSFAALKGKRIGNFGGPGAATTGMPVATSFLSCSECSDSSDPRATMMAS